MDKNERKQFSPFLMLLVALVAAGYGIDNYLLLKLGTVGYWSFKRQLFSDQAVIYAVLLCLGILSVCVAVKIKKPKLLYAGLPVIGTLLFVQLYNAEGNYFSALAQILKYGVTTGLTFWLLAIVWGFPLAILRKATSQYKAKVSLAEARAKSILLDAEGRRQQANYITTAGRSVLAINTATNEKEYHLAPTHADLQETPAKETNLTALDVGLKIQRAMVWGGTGSGKTRFCKTLAHHYLTAGKLVVVFDPEYTDPKDPWPKDAILFGTDDDWDGMEKGWQWIFSLKDERSQHVYDGGDIADFPEVYIFFDEINDTIEERPDFVSSYLKVLRRFRKYRIYIICIGQTDDVESIGIPRKGKIKLSFNAIIQFHQDPNTLEHKSFVDFQDGEGKRELAPYPCVSASQRKNGVSPKAHPAHEAHGAHGAHGTVISSKNLDDSACACAPGAPDAEAITVPALELKPQDDFDYLILDGYQRGFKSMRRLCRHARVSPNGDNIERAKDALSRYGIQTEIKGRKTVFKFAAGE